MEGAECLALSRLAANLNAVHAVVPDDSSPHGIVKVDDQAFAAFAIRRAYQPGQRMRQMDCAAVTDRHFVTEPVVAVKPMVQADSRRQVVDIVDQEFPVGARGAGKLEIEAHQKIRLAKQFGCVQAPEAARRRQVEIILDNQTRQFTGQLTPDRPIVFHLRLQGGIDLLVAVKQTGRVDNVDLGGMDKCDIWAERAQRAIVDDCVFEIFTKLRLKKRGPQASLKQKQFGDAADW